MASSVEAEAGELRGPRTRRHCVVDDLLRNAKDAATQQTSCRSHDELGVVMQCRRRDLDEHRFSDDPTRGRQGSSPNRLVLVLQEHQNPRLVFLTARFAEADDRRWSRRRTGNEGAVALDDVPPELRVRKCP
jgi:hypothetical protein